MISKNVIKVIGEKFLIEAGIFDLFKNRPKLSPEQLKEQEEIAKMMENLNIKKDLRKKLFELTDAIIRKYEDEDMSYDEMQSIITFIFYPDKKNAIIKKFGKFEETENSNSFKKEIVKVRKKFSELGDNEIIGILITSFKG